MAVLPAQTEFESWSAAGSGLRIEYPAALLEQICTEAVEALEATYGGTGIGGVLFGTHKDGTVRVTDFRPLACEHAYGRRFMLSERDCENLRLLLSAPRRDPDLRGLVPVGWYHSIPRGELALTARDTEVHDRFFYRPWQLAIAIRPEREGPSTVAFCVRDGDPRALFKTEVEDRRRSAQKPEAVPEPAPPPAAEPEDTAAQAFSASDASTERQPEPAIPEETIGSGEAALAPEVPKAEPTAPVPQASEAEQVVFETAPPAGEPAPAASEEPPPEASPDDESATAAPSVPDEPEPADTFEPPPPPAPLLPSPASQRQIFPTPPPEQAAPTATAAPQAHAPSAATKDVEAATPGPTSAQFETTLPAWAQAEEPPKRRRWWLWAMPAVLLVAAIAAGAAWYLSDGGGKPELALWVTDLGGQLMIEWDRAAKPIQRATGGIIEIEDGGEHIAIKMDGEKLREGSVDYVRRSEVVDVKLTVALPGGGSEMDTIQFVGPPVARAPVDDVIRERDELKQEVDRLKAQLDSKR